MNDTVHTSPMTPEHMESVSLTAMALSMIKPELRAFAMKELTKRYIACLIRAPT